jgi:16S rRNA G1207 methylase RsmC
VAGHYFSDRPEIASDPSTVTVDVGGVSMELTSDTGVFSRGRLDPGTSVLLREMPLPDGDGPVLDLGCGYGPIACVLATHRPSMPIVGVDVNERALELLRANASRLNLDKVAGSLPDAVDGDQRFTHIYSNPPIRIGKQALHDLLSRWLPRLVPGGTAYLVVQRNLGADSLAKWLAGEGYAVTRIASHRGFRVLQVVNVPG